MLNKLETQSSICDSQADQQANLVDLPLVQLAPLQRNSSLSEATSTLLLPSDQSDESGELGTLLNNLLSSRNDLLRHWGQFSTIFQTRQSTYTPAFWIVLCMITLPVLFWCTLVLPFLGNSTGPCFGDLIWDPYGHNNPNNTRRFADQNLTANSFDFHWNHSINNGGSVAVPCERLVMFSYALLFIFSVGLGLFCAIKRKAKYLTSSDSQIITEIEQIAFADLDDVTRSDIIAPRTYDEARVSVKRALRYTNSRIERVTRELRAQTPENIPNLINAQTFFGRNSLGSERQSLLIAREFMLPESSTVRSGDVDSVVNISDINGEQPDENSGFTLV